MAKFKVGDKVRFTDKCDRGWWFGPHTEIKDGVIIAVGALPYKYTVECSCGKRGYVEGKHIELVTEPTRFKVGDRVVHKVYGVGTVKKDDKTSIPYLVFFDRGAKGWQFESELTPENTTKTTEAQIDAADDGARKFKVGDRVSIVGGAYSTDPKTGIVISVVRVGARDVWAVETNTGQTLNFYDKELSLRYSSPERQSIVALIENGKPRPNKDPYVHATSEEATKEAERLAGKYPGQKFGVYQLVTARIGTVSVAEA